MLDACPRLQARFPTWDRRDDTPDVDSADGYKGGKSNVFASSEGYGKTGEVERQPFRLPHLPIRMPVRPTTGICVPNCIIGLKFVGFSFNSPLWTNTEWPGLLRKVSVVFCWKSPPRTPAALDCRRPPRVEKGNQIRFIVTIGTVRQACKAAALTRQN